MRTEINFYELVIYLIAFIIGLIPVVFTALIVLASMIPAGGMGRSIDTEFYVTLFLLSPIAGLVCFQGIFSLSTGIWRSWWFWLIAPAFVYGTAAIAWWSLESVALDPITFLALLLCFLFSTGLIAMLWRK